MEDRKVMLASANLLQAHTWKGLLENQGIPVELRGETLLGATGELPADVQQVELWVNAEQKPLARDHLDSLQVPKEDWVCIACNEHNEGNFELCWNCGAEQGKQL
ncbi:putative signal transducing protein [Paraferrimonas sedimenticola]|uniref:Zinc-finger-like domain-containing protein n=1 Tax=Paraferrimonas sedimenticola TaxID=375674 RepID=A0AA37RTV0_9GAMM|nr:DUF2007 domain-containing protein [Paraferrimonas sedimenticola]GLP95196.1 zinc-finger-like domain-containing protein [Paraferrimonas sedimenticola]